MIIINKQQSELDFVRANKSNEQKIIETELVKTELMNKELESELKMLRLKVSVGRPPLTEDEKKAKEKQKLKIEMDQLKEKMKQYE